MTSRVLPAPTLRTARAALEPFAGRDATELVAFFRDPGVRRYLLDDELVDADWVGHEIEESARRFAASGAGLWVVRLPPDPDIVGFVGFRPFFDPPRTQLVYGLLPAVWGRGLATEVGERVCAYAFADLGFTEIEAAVDVPNARSIGVLERLGMTRTRIDDGGEAGTAFYRLERRP